MVYDPFKVECFFATQNAISLFSFSSSTNAVRQSAFLMDLIILAAGQETMLQLLSWRSLIKQTVIRPWIDVNSKSKRYLDALREPHFIEKSFMFGRYAPVSDTREVMGATSFKLSNVPLFLDSLIRSHDWDDVRLHISINAWVSESIQ